MPGVSVESIFVQKCRGSSRERKKMMTPNFKLNNGVSVPAQGIGTFLTKNGVPFRMQAQASRFTTPTVSL